MEENENKEEVTEPSREEILAMSREENKNGDEMKKDVYKTAASLAFRVGVLIAIIIGAANLIINRGSTLLLPMYSVIFGMGATDFIYISVKEKRKGMLALSVVLAVTVVMTIVLSILMLCGIV